MGASSAVYVLVYAIGFMMHDLDMRLIDDDIIYLVWSLLLTSMYAMLAGGVSSMASVLFVNYMYKRGGKK